MKRFLLLIKSVLPLLLMGQYTYFNTHIPPLGGPDAGSGTSTNLMVRNNELISVINNPNFGNISMTFNVLNMNGILINQIVNSTNGQLLTNYADSFDDDSEGFISAGLFMQGPWASIRRFNSNLILDWEIKVPIFYDDLNQPVYYTNEIYGEFHFAKKLNNGDILATGPIFYYNENNPLYSKLWMVRYNANQQLLWEKQLPLYSESIIPESKKFLRVNDLFELPNGDLLLWGCWYHSYQPMVLRFDSEGNFLSHTSWGAPGPQGTLNDWLPWPVQINDEEFAFGYTHGTYQNGSFGPTFSKPHVGFFNATTMEVNLLEPIDREAKHHYITDFEKATDGGFVMLGYGIHAHPTDSNLDTEFSYMLKVDENGEEEWYHEYLPPILFLNPWVYDLEVTPDGGYAFVGNFLKSEDPDSSGWPIPIAQHTWVVKTDGCGEIEYNGCAYTVGVNEAIADDKNLKVWPNPVVSNITLEYTPGGVAFIELLDLRGKIIQNLNTQTSQKQFILNLSNVAPGMYTLRAIDKYGKSLAHSKLIRQ